MFYDKTKGTHRETGREKPRKTEKEIDIKRDKEEDRERYDLNHVK